MINLISRGAIQDPAVQREFEHLVTRLRGFLSQSFDEDGDLIVADPNLAVMPVGGMAPYAGTAAPDGWLMCDGGQVSRVTYKALFDVAGTAYGVGDGSTTFNLPDLRQRFLLGKAASGTGATLGSTGGAIDHTHTGPSHTHTGPSHTHSIASEAGDTGSAGSHTHTYSGTTGTSAGGAEGAAGTDGGFLYPSSHGHSYSGTTSSDGSHVHTMAHTHGGNTGAEGTGETGAEGAGATSTANPPYAVVNYIIFAGV